MAALSETPAPRLPNDLESFWMPFTPNREMKRNPMLVTSAEGVWYHTPDGRRILDAAAGLWCVNAATDAKRSPPPSHKPPRP